MPRKRLLWRFYLQFLLIIVLSLLAVGWYASRHMRSFYLKRAEEDLRARAELLEHEVREGLKGTEAAAIDALCKARGKRTGTRITVILESGRVVGDSDEDIAVMDNHATRPEVVSALAGEVGVAARRSTTLRRNMMYVALPIRDGNRVVAVLRTAFPLTHVEQMVQAFCVQIAVGGMVIAALAALVSLGVYRRISRPLGEIRRGAERFAQGDFGARIVVPDSAEVGSLAETMNAMAVQLDYRIKTVIRQRNEQEAVLFSMVEGVLAVDADERLLSINKAAAGMLGTSPEAAQGRTIQEVVRNPVLQELVSRALAEGRPIEGDAVLQGPAEERFIQVHGAVLRDAAGIRIGAVIVLNDVTRLRRLEDLRREFVANVSHELKTPITSIKGFVETLQDGAIDKPEEARQFLAIVAKHADRLNSIIGDLLLLSSIEQEAEESAVEFHEMRLKGAIADAVEACAVKAADKNVTVNVSCPDDLAALMNPPLLHQAVVNLVDNAIKYSEAGGQVEISASRSDAEVLISVRDHGCGIAKEHLPRLGERFYRGDKARSRQQGGTGLGLAIVKHIARAHGGRLSVESELGQGSTFRIHLPVRRDEPAAGKTDN